MFLKALFSEKISQLFLLIVILTFFFFQNSFSYSDSSLLIASKSWSDFASHIPLIRSFSYGSNFFPIENPLFPNEPIRYHFLFYLLVGLFEKAGLRIDFALNILSAFGLTSLLFLLFNFAKTIFKSKAVGILTVSFFLLNGSLSFLYFFEKNPLSFSTINEILSSQTFYSFAPYYGEGIVSAFWNLNIYTNQRHLAFAFALSFFIIFFLIKSISKKTSTLTNKKALLLGIVLGLSYFFNIAVFFMTGIVILVLALLFPKIRIRLFLLLGISTFLSYPQYLYMNTITPGYNFIFNPGYLIANNFSVFNFLKYWIYNLGLHFFLIPIGFFIAPLRVRKIFIAFFTMFVIGNIFQFSPEIAANHKFFNYFMLVGVMFSAYTIVVLWGKRHFPKFFASFLVFFLVLSGIIDLFPILNDKKINIINPSNNEKMKWIKNNTPSDSIFLNSTYLYNPASLAGRKIFLGWPYFPWSAGHDTNSRSVLREQIFSENNKDTACNLLIPNNISYVEINSKNYDKENRNSTISNLYEKEFILAYESSEGFYKIYDVEKSCNRQNY